MVTEGRIICQKKNTEGIPKEILETVSKRYLKMGYLKKRPEKNEKG